MLENETKPFPWHIPSAYSWIFYIFHTPCITLLIKKKVNHLIFILLAMVYPKLSRSPAPLWQPNHISILWIIDKRLHLPNACAVIGEGCAAMWHVTRYDHVAPMEFN